MCGWWRNERYRNYNMNWLTYANFRSTFITLSFEGPPSYCKVNSRYSVTSSIDALKRMASQIEAQMTIELLQFEPKTQSTFAYILEFPDQPRSHKINVEEDDSDTSLAQFLRKQKNEPIDLLNLFWRLCKTPPVFGFNNEETLSFRSRPV